MKKVWWTTGSGRVELQIKWVDAQMCTHAGPCDLDVAHMSKVPYIAAQLEKLDPALLSDELREYGAWDDDERTDHAQNLQRVLWLACNDIVDEERIT